jgi:hypothetical protein
MKELLVLANSGFTLDGFEYLIQLFLALLFVPSLVFVKLLHYEFEFVDIIQ